MLTTLIIEDEKRSRELLHTMLCDYCEDVLVMGKAASVSEALDLIRTYNPQLVFLDIHLKGQMGFELLDALPQRSFEVVFTTAYEEYALQAIKYSGLDYLMKPIALDELRTSLAKAKEKLTRRSTQPSLMEGEEEDSSKRNRVLVPTFKGFILLETSRILYLEAEGSYTRFFFDDNQTILICESIGQCENRLSAANFIRIHRSHVVNIDHIQEYIRGRGGYILLKDGSHLNVSARKKAHLLEALGR